MTDQQKLEQLQKQIAEYESAIEWNTGSVRMKLRRELEQLRTEAFRLQAKALKQP